MARKQLREPDPLSWRGQARIYIRERLRVVPPGLDAKATRRWLNERYPFRSRRGYAYKAWCVELREALAMFLPRERAPLLALRVVVHVQYDGSRRGFVAVRCESCGGTGSPGGLRLPCLYCRDVEMLARRISDDPRFQGLAEDPEAEEILKDFMRDAVDDGLGERLAGRCELETIFHGPPKKRARSGDGTA